MKPYLMLTTALLLTACGEPTPTPTLPTDTVESLVADPERRRELREQCRLNRAAVGDEVCARVAEATNRAFFNDGEVPYTPPEDPPAF
ncbi:MAG: EexN family lipoprotein [Parahaliea sp.]